MFLEPIRMIADWLAIASYGVNALLPSVPRDVGDLQPADIAHVYDESRTGWLARSDDVPQEICADGPVLAVSVLDDATMQSNPQLAIQHWTNTGLPIVVRYLGKNVDSAKGYCDASYSLRAAKSSLLLLALHENLASRERNKVRIARLEDIRIVPMKQPLKDVWVWGGLAASAALQDVIATPS
jgi:hypothetical protein